MNGDLINKVKDGPFLDKQKSATKGGEGKEATAQPKAAV